jgi:hypothetical protein
MMPIDKAKRSDTIPNTKLRTFESSSGYANDASEGNFFHFNKAMPPGTYFG